MGSEASRGPSAIPVAGSTPVFGCIPAGTISQARRAAYAVIRDKGGRVATVGHDGRRFLPGGGSHPLESVAQTVEREVQEELGCSMVIKGSIGNAVQHFFSSDDGCWYSMEATFVRGELVGQSGLPQGHGITWLRDEEAESRLYHACHIWALR